MLKRFRHIRIYEEDYEWLINHFEEDYISHYPEFRNINMTMAFKISKLKSLWENTS